MKKKKRQARIDARLSPDDDKRLKNLITAKGCKGITEFLRLLANAKNIKIEL